MTDVIRETVWCEAHGGLANPHFDRSDCVDPHYTDQQTRERLNTAAPVDPDDQTILIP